MVGLVLLGCAPATSPPPADVTIPPPPAETTAASDRPDAPQSVARPLPRPEADTPEDDRAVAAAMPAPAPTTATPAVGIPPATPFHVEPFLDLRTATPRPPSLLRTELAALQRLLAATSQSAPDRPALLRRLANECVELRKADDASASAEAIRYYTELARSYPSSPNVDEDLYYLALESLVTGDLVGSRKAFYELIKSSPSSRFVPYAYFAFGDVFLQEAATDATKYDLAQQAYTKVLQFPLSAVAPEAAFKLIRVAKAKGDSRLVTQMRALLASQYPHSPAAARARSLP